MSSVWMNEYQEARRGKAANKASESAEPQASSDEKPWQGQSWKSWQWMSRHFYTRGWSFQQCVALTEPKIQKTKWRFSNAMLQICLISCNAARSPVSMSVFSLTTPSSSTLWTTVPLCWSKTHISETNARNMSRTLRATWQTHYSWQWMKVCKQAVNVATGRKISGHFKHSARLFTTSWHPGTVGSAEQVIAARCFYRMEKQLQWGLTDERRLQKQLFHHTVGNNNNIIGTTYKTNLMNIAL